MLTRGILQIPLVNMIFIHLIRPNATLSISTKSLEVFRNPVSLRHEIFHLPLYMLAKNPTTCNFLIKNNPLENKKSNNRTSLKNIMFFMQSKLSIIT